MQILDDVHGPALFASYTRSAARGQLQVPLLRVVRETLMYTRAHTLVTTDYTLYARASVNRSLCRNNNSYDYGERRGARSSACKVVNLRPRHEICRVDIRNTRELPPCILS